MTNGKEQIAETASNTWVWVINSNSSDLPTLQDIIEEAMQEYSDLQNKELKEDRNFWKNDALTSHKSKDEFKKWYNELEDKNKELTERVKELESELTELKERHKRDIETDFKCKCGFGCNTLDALGWHKSTCPLNKK